MVNRYVNQAFFSLVLLSALVLFSLACGPAAPELETNELVARDIYARMEQAMAQPSKVFYTEVQVSQQAGPLSYQGSFEFWANPDQGRARQASKLTPEGGDTRKQEMVLADGVIYPSPYRGMPQAKHPAPQCSDASALISTAIACWRFDRVGETLVEEVQYEGVAALVLVTAVAWSGSDERFDVTRRLYLDAETYLPMSLEIDGTVDYGEVSEVHSRWTYENAFLASESLPDDFFDPSSVGYLGADAAVPGLTGDSPEVPEEFPWTPEQQRQRQQAIEKRDSSLLPECPEEYFAWREQAKEQGLLHDQPPSLDFWENPGCRGTPDEIVRGPASGTVPAAPIATPDAGAGSVTGPTLTPTAIDQSNLPTKDITRVVDANSRFAFDLLEELRQQEGDENLFISPLSLAMALAMVYNGASGETQRAMAETLHLAGMDRDAVNQGNAALLATMAERQPDLELGVANSLWAREGSSFHQSFFDRVSQHYDAEVESLPFGDAAKQRINGWVAEQTNGKIDAILDQINPNDVMYLINAIYFKASWLYVFNEEDTTDGTFQNTDGSEVEVPMMHQDWAKYEYLDGDGFAALRLRYLGDASMYLFLPDQDSSLSEFLGNLEGDAWAQWMEGFQEGGGDITIPRFEIEYDASLNEPLKNMGMEATFSTGADFSGMGPGQLRIDRVKHKAVVEVHEKGTEAAAATVVGMAGSALALTFEFTVDRPFFFAITDDQTGNILFMGTVHELGE